MTLSTRKGRSLPALFVLAGVVVTFWWAVHRLAVNNDITAALPKEDKVVAAAQDILKHHPVLENVFVQIGVSGRGGNRDALVTAADLASGMLSESGLVKVVSLNRTADSFALLLDTVTGNLPLLFSEEALRDQVGGILQPGRLESRLEEAFRRLLDLAGIGQAQYFPRDPLGLRNLFLGRLALSLPFQGVTLEQGQLLSRDGKHLLLVARPNGPSQDASFARAMTGLLERITARLNDLSIPQEKTFRTVYAGTFRAALDNETMIRRDMSRALTLVMLTLIPLALVSFRRPWLGLLSAVPALAGTMLAVSVFAVTGESVFAVAMGFAGALIGIAVDHGLAFAVLLDRPGGSQGPKVSREVWSVGSLPLLSTVAALLTLTLTQIPLFVQVGYLAALGVGLSALFAHFFFPTLFPRLDPPTRERPLMMERLMDRLTAISSRWTVGGCAALALFMLFFAKTEFSLDLTSMNTLSKATAEAERAIHEVWGGMTAKPCVMVRGSTLEDLWEGVDRLGEFLEGERRSSVLAGSLPRAILLPGPEQQEKNFKAWRHFWTPERILHVEKTLREKGEKLGLKKDAFKPFLRTLGGPMPERMVFPQDLLAGFGVFHGGDKGGWVMVDTVTPGPDYEPEVFFEKAQKKGFSLFDPKHFSRHLARELNRAFMKMLLIIGGVTFVLLFLFFLDWQLLLVSLSPLAFSFIATLGTMGLLGLPLSIPSLMLTPLLAGLGLDYGVYLVRSFQRFGAAPHPGSEGFRTTVLLCGITTLIGFGSLLPAEHRVLRDAGISTFLGIFYAMVGAFCIVPPVLRSLFAVPALPGHSFPAGSKEHTRWALMPFRHLEPFLRMSARFKILLDPMFPRLADFVKPGWRLLQVGCGCGIPAAWLLAVYPDLEILGCEPDTERARISQRVLGERARVFHGGAMDLPRDGLHVHAVLVLDLLHRFHDGDMNELLLHLHSVICDRGKLILRLTVPDKAFNLLRSVKEARLRLHGVKPCWRSKEQVVERIRNGGFEMELVEPCAEGSEKTWFVATRVAGEPPFRGGDP